MYQKIKSTALTLLIFLLLSLWVVSLGERRKKEMASDQEINHAFVLQVWYGNTLYEPYLREAAVRFEKLSMEEGYQAEVELKLVPGLEYLSAIEAAGERGEEPDVYLVDSTSLQKLVRIRAADRTEQDKAYTQEKFVSGTWRNLDYQGEYYGYPLGFDTTVLMYNEELIEKLPETLEEIYNFSFSHPEISPAEIFLWDTEQFMCSYGFVGSYALVGGESGYEEKVNLNNQELFQAGELFGQYSMQFAGGSGVTSGEVEQAFSENRLRYAVVNSDVLKNVQGWPVSTGFMVLPDWNDSLKTTPVSVTDIAMVNESTDEKEQAVRFAKYISLEMAEDMYELCGILPLAKTEKIQEQASAFYQAYEKSRSLPKLMSAVDYWSKMQDALIKIKDGADAAEIFAGLQETMSIQVKEK